MLVVMYAVKRDDRVRRWGWRWKRMLLVHERTHINEDYSRDSRAVSRLCRLLLAVLVLRGCRGQVYFGSQTRHHLNISLVIESLSKEQIDIFIREEQLDA